jgi:hypothetical protein
LHVPLLAPEFGAYYLGWNASGWAPAEAAAHAALSHPRGDVKKLSLSSEGLRLARFSFDSDGWGAGAGSARGPKTHYQARIRMLVPAQPRTHAPGVHNCRPVLPSGAQVRWTAGGTDAGSSGAPLLGASQQQVLGVLTGGEAATCRNTDYFGSLFAVRARRPCTRCAARSSFTGEQHRA